MNKEIESIVDDLKESFVPILQELFGDDLQTVIMYGSAAKGTYVAGVSDVNLLLLAGETHPEAIMKLGNRAKKQINKHRLSVQFLTTSEFKNSADVFPMEYLDIQNSHILVWGSADLEALKIESTYLRHQVEERLRGSVHALRQALFASQGKAKLLSGVLKEWFGSQTALLRAVLRLAGASSVPENSRELVDAIGSTFALDPAALYPLLQLREGDKSGDAAQIAVQTLQFLTQLVQKVDSMEIGSSS
ncbi:MAG: hypothetical protein K9M94_11860 [Spirochaetia bacterium]|nr:hypothetical protein [Spirochaetia bacterium]